MGTDYGYIRVSSRDQNVARQIYAMEQKGILRKNIYIDKQSGKNFNRKKYKSLVGKMQEDDNLFVGSINRFGRNYIEITEQWRFLIREKKVNIIVMDMPLLDTRLQKDLLGSFIADLVLYILSYVAESERNNIRQYQAEGIARAKERGVKFGRPPLMDVGEFMDRYLEFQGKGYNLKEIAKIMNMSVSTIYRYKNNIGMIENIQEMSDML